MEMQRIQKGMRVKWQDPGINDYDPEDRQAILDRVFVVDDIVGDEDIADRWMHITEEDGPSEAEVWEHELIVIGV